MDLAIIGNCQYTALVDGAGKIVWLCWPRFDSSCVFGELLDPNAGSFAITCPDRSTVEQGYLRNTNILRTAYTSARGSFEILDFAPRFALHNRMYVPTMLVRVVRPLAGEPSVVVDLRPKYDYGQIEPREVWGSNHLEFEGFPERLRLTTNAPRTYLHSRQRFLLETTRYFVLTWGAPLEAPLVETCETFLRDTAHYWRTWVKHCSVPSNYQDEVIRSALVLKLHQFADTGAITAASTTSLPEAPGSGRNWDYRYCWLRDAYFTLSALRHLGHFEEIEAFIGYLRNIAETSTSHLQPVYGIGAEAELTEHILGHLEGYERNAPVRVGNAAYTHWQHDCYGEMILAISPLLLDARFAADEELRPMPLVTRLLRDIDRYRFEPDAGIWEFRTTSQLHTFSLLMHWAGAREVMAIAKHAGDAELLATATRIHDEVARRIETGCWDAARGCYVQAEGGKYLDASLLMMVNLGYLERGNPRALSHIHATAEALATPSGFLYRYVHPDDFGKPQVAFTVCGFWWAEALARQGRTAEARKVFDRYLAAQNKLGLFSEDYDPIARRQWGNLPQTYSHVGLINAAFAIDRYAG